MRNLSILFLSLITFSISTSFFASKTVLADQSNSFIPNTTENLPAAVRDSKIMGPYASIGGIGPHASGFDVPSDSLPQPW